MQAGKLRCRVTIEAPTVTQNEFGEPVTTWTTLATVRASKEDLTGREAFLAMQVKSQQQTRFTMRYLADVLPTMRLVIGDRNNPPADIYGIESIADPDGR